jgi:hypothetical protein
MDPFNRGTEAGEYSQALYSPKTLLAILVNAEEYYWFTTIGYILIAYDIYNIEIARSNQRTTTFGS